MKKLIKDGMVAVLVSPGYGAGWSTWNLEHPECLFDPEIVQMVLDGKDYHEVEQFADSKYGDDFYVGGADGLIVQWVAQGKKFYIAEYDGSETLVTEDDLMEA